VTITDQQKYDNVDDGNDDISQEAIADTLRLQVVSWRTIIHIWSGNDVNKDCPQQDKDQAFRDKDKDKDWTYEEL